MEVLLDALARLHAHDPSWRLLLVGDGPRGRPCEAAAGPHVELAGPLAPAEVAALLHRMDVACAPYADMQGLYFSPLKVYEYLAAGLPVVASAVGQLPAALAPGGWAASSPAGDAAALATALRALPADPERLRLRRSDGAAVERTHLGGGRRPRSRPRPGPERGGALMAGVPRPARGRPRPPPHPAPFRPHVPSSAGCCRGGAPCSPRWRCGCSSRGR